MPGNFKKEDLRVLKTHKALMAAMSKLLELRNFTQITVNDLCGEAQISRTTFYLHFNDKYDFLNYWLKNMEILVEYKSGTYEEMEQSVNSFLNKNSKIIRNLIENANNETYELLCDFISSLIKIRKIDGQMKYIVLSQFCAGGMMNYLKWQIKNKFPSDLPIINPYIYDILIDLHKWNEGQE